MTHRLRLVFVSLSLWAAAVSFAQSPLKDFLSSKERPAIKEIILDFEDKDGLKGSLPIVVFKGLEEGPVFTIVAGVHGFEYPPIIAMQQILKELEADQLKGNLIIIPVANTASFYTRTPFINPTDGKNLNRAFPGDPEGSITEKLAHYIAENIIPPSDIFLDIHGGDACEDLVPFVCYYDNPRKSKQTQLARRLSEQSGFELVVSYPYTLADTDPAQFVFKQVVQDGKTGLSIESGRLGVAEPEAVKLIVDGVFNMLAEMEMYPDTNRRTAPPDILNQQTYIRSGQSGIFYTSRKAGESIEKGALVGYTTDLFGKVIEEHKAPVSGVILYMLSTPPINKGDTVMCIGSRS